MRVFKNIWSQLHTFVLWLLLSAVLWGWIFTFVTDTTPDKKITVYCHTAAVQDTAMAAALEKDMPEGLRMIKVHSFDYVMFNTDEINRGDLYIIPASEVQTFADSLVPVMDGQGVKVYDAAFGTGVAMQYIQYGSEDFYLFFGTGSVHLDDGKALAVAMNLLALK